MIVKIINTTSPLRGIELIHPLEENPQSAWIYWNNRLCEYSTDMGGLILLLKGFDRNLEETRKYSKLLSTIAKIAIQTYMIEKLVDKLKEK